MRHVGVVVRCVWERGGGRLSRISDYLFLFSFCGVMRSLIKKLYTRDLHTKAVTCAESLTLLTIVLDVDRIELMYVDRTEHQHEHA